MNLPDTSEDHVPVGSAKVGRAAKTSDGILVGVGIVDHNVCRIVGLDSGGEICVNLNAVVQILSFDSEKKRTEPLERVEVTANPEEVNLGQSCLLLGVVHSVPDGLEDGGEGCHTDTSTDEDRDFILEDIFRGRTKGAVDVDSGEDTTDSWVDFGLAACKTDNLTSIASILLLAPITAQRLGKLLGEVTNATHVDGDVVLLGGAGQSKGVVLPERHGWAAEEDVLTSSCLGVLLLHLDLANVAGVLDDLGDECPVTTSHLTRNTLSQVAETTVHPELPKDSNG